MEIIADNLELFLPSCEQQAGLYLWKEDSEVYCDLSFDSFAGRQIVYMMASDARMLAKWILENVEES